MHRLIDEVEVLYNDVVDFLCSCVWFSLLPIVSK